MALIIVPKVFTEYPKVRAAMTLRGRGRTPFDSNLSASVGDGERSAVNRKKLALRLGFSPDRMAMQNQVHGNRIAYVQDDYTPGESDALVTDRAGWLLAVSVADCVPVLLYGPEQHVVAGVHSGWRGTVRGVVPSTVEYLSAEFGVRASMLKAWVGPSAGQCCYEVGSDVAGLFAERHSREIGGGKFLLDNRGAVLAALLNAGLTPDHIEADIRCTICDERFHSYRREGDRSGRMFAVIGMT